MEQFVRKTLEGPVQESLTIKNFICPHHGVKYKPYPFGICAEGKWKSFFFFLRFLPNSCHMDLILGV